MQYWFLERVTDEKVRLLYICNANDRETAKRMASRYLLGDPDSYIVLPLTNPNDVAKLRFNIETAT